MTAQRAAHIPHVLHTGQRIWITANPSVSLWVELLHAWGFEPLAALACAVLLDFEGDQFKSLMLPADDLKKLYGVSAFPLTVYDRLETHIAAQTREGHVVLVEVDSFHLPDSPDLYGVRHGATMVAIDRLEPAVNGSDGPGSASYYRQGRRYELTGDDFIGVFGQIDVSDGFHPSLLRKVTCVKRSSPALPSEALAAFSMQLFRRHIAQIPARNPITAFRLVFHDALETLAASDEAHRHAFVYGTLSQLGSHFELLAAYMSWLGEQRYPQPKAVLQACRKIVSEALVCQLRLLRATSRGQIDRCEDSLDRIEHSYNSVVQGLNRI